jgi:DNA-binding LacI/PurR family transcriptional regulator
MELFRNNSLPEMLFASTFPVAVGIMEAAKDVSVKIPEDLDLICFGDSELNDYLSPSLTCVTHDTAKFAEEAFDLLINQIEKEDCKEEHLEIETKLLIKETCINKKRK